MPKVEICGDAPGEALTDGPGRQQLANVLLVLLKFTVRRLIGKSFAFVIFMFMLRRKMSLKEPQT